jgi:hypothetical protein
VLEFLRFALLLSENIVLSNDGFAHNLSDTVDRLVIDWLVLVRRLVHCQEIQNVLVIALIDEEFVLIFLDDDVPRVERLVGCHDS